MQYNQHTEMNNGYKTNGICRVRQAKHPYSENQWEDWIDMHDDYSYQINETKEEAELTSAAHPLTGEPLDLQQRNKHEIYIQNGYFSHCCTFDPAPIGDEEHVKGTQSCYGDVNQQLTEEKLNSIRYM